MAEWKKVIVSGSTAQLATLQVGSNQQITNSQATTYLTGSFTGSFTGNGAGLSGLIAAAGTVSSSAQTIAHLPTGTVSGSSQVLGGTTIHSGSFFNGITVVSGSAQITYSGLTGTPAGIVSGSSQILAGSTIHSGSFFNGITVVSGSSQISYTGLANTPAGIVSGSVTLGVGSGQGTHTITTNGVTSGDVAVAGLGTAGTPTFAGLTISTNALAVNNTNGITTTQTTFPIANATATTINLGGAATAINIGAATGTTTVNNNLSVLGTLYVQGSVTAISSSNLYVADQFILLASGSVGDTDGGIIIDRGTYSSGNIAFGYDAGTDRWGFQNGLVDTTNAIDTTSASGVSGSFAVYSFTEASHGATKPITGEFAVVGSQYLDNAGNFWIYTV